VLISETLIAWATPETFGAVAFLSAAALNLLIPSGGGQWAVQGPILAEAGLALGVDPATIVVAFSHGDACTNLLQPFWALPLLGLMRLRAGQIIGYSVIACGVMLVIDVVVLLLTE
jgi:short-chain fatty acids transporter